MKNMERERFEESWKKAFEKAEVSPSDAVWTNIELDLERAKGGELRKRVMFYKMLAAASVIFAMAIGGIGYYYSFGPSRTTNNGLALQEIHKQESEQPTTREPLSADKQSKSTPSLNSPLNPSKQPSPTDARRTLEDGATAYNFSKDASSTRSDQTGAPTINQQQSANPKDTRMETSSYDASFTSLPSGVTDEKLPPLYAPRQIVLDFNKQQDIVDPVMAMMARLEAREKELQDDKGEREQNENVDENLWTSIGFAAGSFNTVQASAPASNARPATLAMAAAPIVDQEAKATGYSYSMGVNVGTKLSDRWVFQGGVNYLTHASEYVANNVVMEGPANFQQQKFRAVSTNELMYTDAGDLSDKLVYSAPYSVNNNMRYLSIPLQAGYLVVNRTFGLQLNAGLATDLFLQNTISGQSDQLAKTSQSMGSESPYRTVNLSGLFGTEFSYRFGDHYRVSLNPGLRYPLNTIYKSELGVQSTPLTFDVGLRFRYIFR